MEYDIDRGITVGGHDIERDLAAGLHTIAGEIHKAAEEISHLQRKFSIRHTTALIIGTIAYLVVAIAVIYVYDSVIIRIAMIIGKGFVGVGIIIVKWNMIRIITLQYRIQMWQGEAQNLQRFKERLDRNEISLF